MSFIGDLLFDFLDFYIEESRHQEVVGAINGKNAKASNKTASQSVEAENKALKRKLEKGGTK